MSSNKSGVISKRKDVLTTGEIAKICNVSPRTVCKWLTAGQLRGYRLPGRGDRRILLQELARFMRAHGVPLVHQDQVGHFAWRALIKLTPGNHHGVVGFDLIGYGDSWPAPGVTSFGARKNPRYSRGYRLY